MKKSALEHEFLNLDEQLALLFSGAAKRAFGIDTDVVITRAAKDRDAHYQCNSAMKIGKEHGSNPRDVATALVENLEDPSKMIAKTEIAGPGFINITLDSAFLSGQLSQILFDERLGVPLCAQKERIVCEFSSPNIAKAMHVGHLRSTIIGDAIARLLEFLGHEVIRLNHIGDWGTQFGMLIGFLKRHHPSILDGEETADVETLMQWYKESKKTFDEDPEFKKEALEEVVKLQSGNDDSLKAWKKICDISRKAFDLIYDQLDVAVSERGESFYNPYLPQVISDLEKKGLLQEDAGAKCVFLEGFENKEGKPLPLIVQKKDGGYLYATTDLAGFHYRLDHDKASRIIIVTDVGQSLHFKMVFAAAQAVGYVDDAKHTFHHVPFGLVLAPDGKKFKTRSGETERLSDLLDEAVLRAKKILEDRDVEDLDEAARVLGIGSVKYADLSCNRIKDYTFSYDRMLKFEGNTAAFILYAYVRIQSIKRKMDLDLEKVLQENEIALNHPSEIALGLVLRQFGETCRSMDQELLPNRMTDYLYHVAEAFHAFFRDCHVANTPEQNARVMLIELTARIIAKGLSILGIGTLSKM